MLEVCSGNTNEKEKDGGIRGPVGLWSEGPRATGASLCAMCSSVCSRFKICWFCCCVPVNLIDLNESESTYLLEESASPFMEEGDGFTSEREGVCSLLSLASHIGRYKMMVGAYNTIGC